MARMDNVAIATLAPPFERTALLELRTAPDGPAARAGSKARAGARGVMRHEVAGERSGHSRRTW